MAVKKPNKDCFIIMPITTPTDLVEKYSGDKDHFKHVLNHLFVPAIKKAGFNPIEPVTKGSNLIHGDIIKNIEKCQFLLCDMSILNPNVFFELGIRTALNKRVALVKDSATPKVPFDTGIINNYTYSHLLRPWTQEEEIEKLSDHLTASFVGGKDENSLWSYFSISAKSTPLESGSDEESRLDFLTQQISALRNEVVLSKSESQSDRRTLNLSQSDIASLLGGLTPKELAEEAVSKAAGHLGLNISIADNLPTNNVVVKTNEFISNDQARALDRAAANYGLRVTFVPVKQ